MKETNIMLLDIFRGGYSAQFMQWFALQSPEIQHLVKLDAARELQAGGKRGASEISTVSPGETTEYTVVFPSVSPRLSTIDIWQGILNSMVGPGRAFVTRVQFWMADKKAKVHFYTVYPYESHVISLLSSQQTYKILEGSLRRHDTTMDTE